MKQDSTEFFGRWIGITAHRLSHLMSKTLHKNGFDMTHEQLILLLIISREKGINQKELSQRLDRDKTSIARSISKLEKSHRVVRIQVGEDKRINNLYLTKEGSQLLDEIFPVFKAVRAELTQEFTVEEIETVVSFMKRLTNKVIELEKKL